MERGGGSGGGSVSLPLPPTHCPTRAWLRLVHLRCTCESSRTEYSWPALGSGQREKRSLAGHRACGRSLGLAGQRGTTTRYHLGMSALLAPSSGCSKRAWELTVVEGGGGGQ